MNAVAAYVHPHDRHVLVSHDINDIPQADGLSYKAGVFKAAANDEIRQNLAGLGPASFSLSERFSLFASPDDANSKLKKYLSLETLRLFAEINSHFATLAQGQETAFIIAHNVGETKKASLRMHFEGMNERGPSMQRDLRGNLSVSKEEGREQIIWVATDEMTEADVWEIAGKDMSTAEKRRQVLEQTGIPEERCRIESSASGDFVLLHGLDGTHSNRLTDGLLHQGPAPHKRTSIIWGIVRRDCI